MTDATVTPVSDFTVGELVTRVRAIAKNLGPRNPYRLALLACVEAIEGLGRDLVQTRRRLAFTQAQLAARPTSHVTITPISDDAPPAPTESR